MTALPPGWEIRPLIEVAEVRLGRQRSPKNHAGDHMRPYLRAANVGWDGLHLDDVKEMNFSDEELQTYRLQPGDVVLSEASGSAGEAGKPAMWSGEIADCAFQNTLLRVRSRGPEPRYLLYWFRKLATNGEFAAQSRGVGIHHIGRAKLASWPVPLPPIAEQRRIVEMLEAYLSHLDAAEAALKQALRRCVAYRRACLDVVTESPAAVRVRLTDLVERVEAGKSFGSAARHAGPDEWGIIKVSAMTWGTFNPNENKVVSDVDRVDPRFEIRPNDVLVSRANTTEYVGAPVLVRETRPRLLLSDKSLRLIPRSTCLPEYLASVLGAPRARDQISRRATGTKDSMRNISQPALLDIEVPWVDPAAQAETVAALRSAEASIQRLRADIDVARARSTALRRALLHAAFSGRLAGTALDLDRTDEAIA